jgi:hypothetical protein
MLVGAGGNGQMTPQQTPVPTHPQKPVFMPGSDPPDANEQMTMRDQMVRRRNYDAVNAVRIRQIKSDTDQLLKLATEMNAGLSGAASPESDKAAQAQAEEIERLAHGVQEKMKLSVGAN